MSATASSSSVGARTRSGTQRRNTKRAAEEDADATVLPPKKKAAPQNKAGGRRPLQDVEEVEVVSRAELRSWLQDNHLRRERGVFLVTFKKAAGERYVPRRDIVCELLCFGWIDSVTRVKDELRTMLYIAPRRHKSHWSRVNKDLVAELEREGGRMAPAGRAAIEHAKASGTWSALDEVDSLLVPPDLQRALREAAAAASSAGDGDGGGGGASHLGGEAVWESWPQSVRRFALYQVLNAKRPETRQRKIGEIVRAAQAGVRPFQMAGDRKPE